MQKSIEFTYLTVKFHNNHIKVRSTCTGRGAEAANGVAGRWDDGGLGVEAVWARAVTASFTSASVDFTALPLFVEDEAMKAVAAVPPLRGWEGFGGTADAAFKASWTAVIFKVNPSFEPIVCKI